MKGGQGSISRVFIDNPQPTDFSFNLMKDNKDFQSNEKNKKGTITSLSNYNNFLSPKFNGFNELDIPQAKYKN